MTDYFSIISRAVSALEPNLEGRRRAIYDRARNALAERLYATEPPLSIRSIQNEQAALEDAIERVEDACLAIAAAPAPPPEPPPEPLPPEPLPPEPDMRIAPPVDDRIAWPEPPREAALPEAYPPEGYAAEAYEAESAVEAEVPADPPPEGYASAAAPSLLPPQLTPQRLAIVGVFIVLLIGGVAGIAVLSRPANRPPAPQPAPTAAAPAASSMAPPPASSAASSASAAAPAVTPAPVTPAPAPATARNDAVPFFYNRQPVYFRSTYPVGSIVVDKTQHFLYVVRPDVVAWRYGIGIGPDCTDVVGLSEVSKKDDAAAGGTPAERAIYFGGGKNRIYGTNAPQAIGRNARTGCFALTSDDMADLYNRVDQGAKVIVKE